MKLSNTFPEPSGSDETAPVAHSPAGSFPLLNQRGDDEAAGAELFAIPESKSPKLRWMERHHITVRQNDQSAPAKAYEAYYGMDRIATGPSETDALVAAAKSLNIPLWNEQ